MNVFTLSNLTGVMLSSGKEEELDKGRTACAWACTASCPKIDGVSVYCDKCPANGLTDEKTYKQAVQWWGKQEFKKEQGC